MNRTGHIPSAKGAAASLQAGAGSAVFGYGHIKEEAMLEAQTGSGSRQGGHARTSRQSR